MFKIEFTTRPRCRQLKLPCLSTEVALIWDLIPYSNFRIIKLRLELNYLLTSLCYIIRGGFFFLALVSLKNSWTGVISWDLFSKPSYKIEFSLLVDPVSLIFGSLVLLITGSVILFSKYYIKTEIFYFRFHAILMLFVISMLALVFGIRLISLVLGWDGLGVTSYLLVIYYSSWKSSNAGILTALINRVGDVFILLAIGFFLLEGGYNLNLTALQSSSRAVYPVCLLVLARITKSAQIPFSAWLPAAIAAPTPVSSLVHSSTLVTAGVYLTVRFQAPLRARSFRLALLLFIGTVTMVIAGISALSEIDIKKIVALSTLRQLGLIIRAMGCNNWVIGYFHLLTHAYVKALLFMSVGNLIHAALDYQDLRKRHLSISSLPLSSAFLLCTNISLCGFPFFSTFYSKDIWLESAYIATLPSFIYLLFVLAVAITVLYSTRLIFYLLIRKSERFSVALQSEENVDFKLSVRFLWMVALLSGPTLGWLVLKTPIIVFLPTDIKVLTLKVILLSVLGYFLFLRKYLYSKKERVFWSLSNIWALPFISAPWLIKTYIVSLNKVAFYIEKGNISYWRYLRWGHQSKKESASVWGEYSNKYQHLLAIAFLVLGLVVI